MQNNEQIQVARELGLRDEEYQRILDILQRPPTPTELAMFSVEWSETVATRILAVGLNSSHGRKISGSGR